MGNLHSSWAITRKKDNKKEQENKKTKKQKNYRNC